MSNHTPEPWKINDTRGYLWEICDTGTHEVIFSARLTLSGAQRWQSPDKAIADDKACLIATANAARIVACVNALADRDPARLGELERVAGNAQSILSLVRHRGLGNSIGQMKPEELEEYENAIRTALAAFRTPVAKAKETQ